MTERRKLIRRHLRSYLRIHNAATSEFIGLLVDITPKGIMILSKDSIPVGRYLRVAIALPASMTPPKELVMDVVSVWVGEDRIRPEEFNIGFRIVHSDDMLEQSILKLIDALGLRVTR